MIQKLQQMTKAHVNTSKFATTNKESLFVLLIELAQENE